MRHRNSLRKLGKTPAHRRALLRSMATSLVLEEKFQTTVGKAKDLRRVVEKLVTSARKDTLPARRNAYSYLLDKGAVHKLFADLGPRFKNRNGGYTRVTRTGVRHGDAAELAVIEFLAEEAKSSTPKAAGKAGKSRKKSAAPASKGEAKEAAKAS